MTLIGGFGVVGGNWVHRQLFPQSLPSFKAHKYFRQRCGLLIQTPVFSKRTAKLLTSFWRCKSRGTVNHFRASESMVGNEEGLYLFLWACTQLQTSGASQKGAPARTPWAKRPNITLQSFEIPQSWYNKSCFYTRAGSQPEDRPMREKLPFHSFTLCLGHLKMTGVFYIQAPSQVKNIDLFSKFWPREFNQFISLSSDVNFLGQPLVVLGAEKWGQFLMRWNSKEMRLKKQSFIHHRRSMFTRTLRADSGMEGTL